MGIGEGCGGVFGRYFPKIIYFSAINCIFSYLDIHFVIKKRKFLIHSSRVSIILIYPTEILSKLCQFSTGNRKNG